MALVSHIFRILYSYEAKVCGQSTHIVRITDTL